MKTMPYKKSLIIGMISFFSFFSGLSGAVTYTISEAVIGHAPLINTHSYNNSHPKVGDALVIRVIASDPDGDPIISLAYQWLLDGNDISGETKASYTIRPSDTGHRVSVKVKVQTDPLITMPDSTEQTFSDITLAAPTGHAPVVASAKIDGVPNVGSTLTAKYSFTDAENDVEGSSIFIWYRDGKLISGETKKTYILTAIDKGKSISVSITPVSATGIPAMGNMITSPAISGITDALVSCNAPITSIIDDYLIKYPDLPEYKKNDIKTKTSIASMNTLVDGNSYWSSKSSSLVYLSKVPCQ